tara:strand:- start:22 stop:429 length:408 start_codon:yes stop_codon:yes gene_type:complete
MITAMDTKTTVQAIEERRRELVEQLLGMRSLVRGALSEQYLKVPQKSQEEPALRGPYYVLSQSVKGRTQSRRIKKKEAERVRQDVNNYKCFEAVCFELSELTEQLGDLERESRASEDAVKKRLKSQSNRAKKSRD